MVNKHGESPWQGLLSALMIIPIPLQRLFVLPTSSSSPAHRTNTVLLGDRLRITESTEWRVGAPCFGISRTLPALLHHQFSHSMEMASLFSSKSWMNRTFWGLGGFLPVSDSEGQLRSVSLPQPLPEPLALAKLFWRLGLVFIGFSWLFLTCRLSPSLQALFFAESQTACKISDFESRKQHMLSRH